MTRLHYGLAVEFNELERRLTRLREPNEEALADLEEERLKIEKREPAMYRILDIMCHNEMVKALGYDPSELYDIPWSKRLVAQWVKSGHEAIRKRVPNQVAS